MSVLDALRNSDNAVGALVFHYRHQQIQGAVAQHLEKLNATFLNDPHPPDERLCHAPVILLTIHGYPLSGYQHAVVFAPLLTDTLKTVLFDRLYTDF